MNRYTITIKDDVDRCHIMEVVADGFSDAEREAFNKICGQMDSFCSYKIITISLVEEL